MCIRDRLQIPQHAYYIIERNSCNFQAVGSNVYKPTSSVRITEFNLTDEHFLDPYSLGVQFYVVNTDTSAKTVYPISVAHGWISCARLLSRGVVLEDISEYNRVHQML